MTKKQKKSIGIGTKIEANWGATYPIEEGVIAYVTEDNFAVIEWNKEDLEAQFIRIKDIKKPGETSVNGSPIGIFFGEE